VRHIGVDLHQTNFVVCFIEADDTRRFETYSLTGDGLARFKEQLEASDELAVAATQHVHYCSDQVREHVRRVAVVDTYRFGVVAKSKQQTDKADAAALARFLRSGWLPEVQVASERVRELRQLLQARALLVSMHPKVKNMAHAAFSRRRRRPCPRRFRLGGGSGAVDGARGTARRRPARARRGAAADRATRRGDQGGRGGSGHAGQVTARGEQTLAGAGAEPAVGHLAAGGGRRDRALRDLEAVGLLRGAGDFDEAVMRDEQTRRGHEAWAEAVAHRLYPGGAGKGESDGHCTDEFLSAEEAGAGAGQAICATARKLLTIIFVLLKKGLDYWYWEDRWYNRKLRALNAAA